MFDPHVLLIEEVGRAAVVERDAVLLVFRIVGYRDYLPDSPGEREAPDQRKTGRAKIEPVVSRTGMGLGGRCSPAGEARDSS